MKAVILFIAGLLIGSGITSVSCSIYGEIYQNGKYEIIRDLLEM